MATFANLSLNDGLATPVAHIFAVKSNDNNVSVYEDRVVGVPAGYSKVIARISETSDQRTVKFDILVPILEAVSGANAQGYTPPAKVAFQALCKVEFRTSMRSSLQQRKDIVAYVKSLVNSALVSSVVVDTESIN